MIDNGTDVVTAIAGGSAFVTLAAWMIRKSWGQIVGAKTDTHSAETDRAKLEADRAIFTNMQSELTRLASEMQQIKIDHKAERMELEHRIDELEAKIQKLSSHIGKIRRHSLEAYAALTTIKECNGCKGVQDAITSLKKILDED